MISNFSGWLNCAQKEKRRRNGTGVALNMADVVKPIAVWNKFFVKLIELSRLQYTA